MDEALKAVNPNFAKGLEWQKNCQRCVYAYEMQRRGYDVEALPRILNGNDDAARQWAKVMEGQTWDKFTSHNTISQMLQKMSEYGDGARAVVYVAWKGHKSAHVFIAEQEGIGTVFLDPQTGHYVDINHYMQYAIKGQTKLSRIDHLKPTDLITKYVKHR